MREATEFAAGQHGVLGDEDAEFASDSARGYGMIPRNHYGSDSCGFAGLNRLPDIGPQGITHASQAKQSETAFDFFDIVTGRQAVPLPARNGEYTKTTLRHRLSSRQHPFVVHGDYTVIQEACAATFNDCLRCALRVGNESRSVGVNRRHPLAIGVKRELQ